MCGIVGFYRPERPSESFPQTLCRMLALIRHRGPDEMGYYFDEQVGLGAARLSIIDLASGQQPMTAGNGRYWIVYNGEAYNYLELRAELESLGQRFDTDSDTEVVLRAFIEWGVAAFDKFNGGFAFAIYDRDEESLVLVRDRYGKRPLYYSHREQGWVFASEIKCFLGYDNQPPQLDVEQLPSIFTLWTPLPHQSGYRDIHQVPDGSFVRLTRGRAPEIVRYYALDFRAGARGVTPPSSEEEATTRTRSALSESVRLRLRSDVEVGTYLSGGLDSTITTLLATQYASQTVRTFSVSFAETAFDESPDQIAMSDYLGTRHSALRVTNQEIADAFPAALWHGETPVFRTAFVPMYLLAQQVQREGIKVVLTGEGSDESFLGYDIFKETRLRLLWHSLESGEAQERELRNLYPYQAHFQNGAASLVGLFDRYSQEQEPGLFSHDIRFANGRFTARLLTQPVADPFAAIRSFLRDAGDEFSSLSPLQKAQWLEFKTLLGGYLLSTQGDRMSFAGSVESRMPFLDPHVVHLAWALPEEMKLRGNDEKYILKRAFAAELPEHILRKPKQPYLAPDALAFFSGQPPAYLELVQSSQELQKLDFIDAVFAQRLVAKLQNTAPAAVSPRENQAFLFLLSLALLRHQWSERATQLPAPATIESLLVRTIDGRESIPALSFAGR